MEKIVREILENIEYSIKPKYYLINKEYEKEPISPSFLIELIYIKNKIKNDIDISKERNNKYKIRKINLQRIKNVDDLKIVSMIYNRNEKAIDYSIKKYLENKDDFFKLYDKLTIKFSNVIKIKYEYLKKILFEIEQLEIENKKEMRDCIKYLIYYFVHYIVNSTQENKDEKINDLIEEFKGR